MNLLIRGESIAAEDSVTCFFTGPMTATKYRGIYYATVGKVINDLEENLIFKTCLPSYLAITLFFILPVL